jgi:enoyl-CoA hydratase/carnithine racemase
VLGTARFGRLVGTGEARRILETSAVFDAERGLRNGFIDQLAPPQQWEDLASEQARRASMLPAESRALLYRALDSERRDSDLADLVRSAAKPGLKERIDAYRRAAAAPQAHPL